MPPTCSGTSHKPAAASEKHGPDSKAFKKSMRRSLPGTGSLIFQTAAAILALVLSV